MYVTTTIDNQSYYHYHLLESHYDLVLNLNDPI